jgi:hypothetical protein
MTTPSLLLRSAAVVSSLAAAYFAGAAQPLTARPPSSPETFLHAVEYRTPTKLDMPLPSATDNVLLYQVPAGKRLRVQSYLLPLGVPDTGTNSLAPLGLGVMQGEKTAAPRTVAFGNAYDLVRVEPGIIFESGEKIVARFDSTVKGLTGSLFLHGTIEDSPTADAR